MKFYVLEIKMLNIEPTIWRKFIVPASITLDRLHDVIQIIMDFEDRHLFEFIIAGKRYAENVASEEPEFEGEGLECGHFALSELVKRAKTKFRYHYDFGDNWQFEITLENSNYTMKPDDFIFQILEGERSTPPEDVGGAPGYEHFCAVMKNKKHPEYKDMLEWNGGEFDPEEYVMGWAQLGLYRYFRHSRNRLREWDYS